MMMGLQCAVQHDNRSSAAYTDIIHVSPLQKTYQTGDTIWFSYSNPGILELVPDSLKGPDTSLDYQIGMQQAMAIQVQ